MGECLHLYLSIQWIFIIVGLTKLLLTIAFVQLAGKLYTHAR